MYNNKWEVQLATKMSLKRYGHCLRVMAMAMDLGCQYGADLDQVQTAALLHDVAKELSFSQYEAYLEQTPLKDWSDEDRHNSDLTHAFIGAYLAEKDWGVQDPEVLTAISLHTLGAANMSVLSKIIFLADLLEAGRTFPGVDFLRTMVKQDLDLAMFYALEHTLNWLQQSGKKIHPYSEDAYEYYKEITEEKRLKKKIKEKD